MNPRANVERSDALWVDGIGIKNKHSAETFPHDRTPHNFFSRRAGLQRDF